MMVIGAVIGLLYLGLIFLLRGADLVTVVGSIAWLIVASVILIYFISKKEETS
jgi:CHASE2 domain-containing sensor protein